ncbi:MAG: 50S ribosomal protein L23 [Legionellaceae bacterium]|nr:50S ribosomal protein L23 [Legionellaceae bacterium]
MNQERILMVLRASHVSEKSTGLADKCKQFVFKVLKTATKTEVMQAVESLFSVKVMNVTTLNVQGKTKRFKNKMGRRSDWKKAYVRLQPGYDIDFTAIQ